MKLPRLLATFLLVAILSMGALADTIVNWEVGFEIDVPTTWLRQQGGPTGVRLASEDVRLDVEPYTGVSQSAQIERLHIDTKKAGYQFKSERSFTIHEVPTHEMIFYKDGNYLIYYVMMAGQRGILITLHSEGTDTPAFKEAQDAITDFRVTPRT